MALATFKCVDKTVQVNPSIFEFTLIDPDIEEVIDLTVNNIHSEDFLEIIKFYEGYNFDKTQFSNPAVYKRKIVSPNIAENLGEKNYKLINNLVFGSKDLKLDRAKRLFDIIIRYGFEEYKFVLLSAMGTAFYLKEFQEDHMDYYLGQFGLTYNYDDRNLIKYLNMTRD